MSTAIITDDIDIGSTGTLARQLFENGKHIGKQPIVYLSRGKKRKESGVYKYECFIEIVIHKLLTLFLGDQGCHSALATKRLIRMMKKNETDSAIIISLHDYSLMEKILFEYFKKKHIKVVYVTIDQYAALGKCCYANGCENYKTRCGDCPQVSEYPKSLFFDKSRKIYEMKENAYKDFEHILFAGPEFNLDLFRSSPLTKDIHLESINWGIDLDKYRYNYDESIYEKYSIPLKKIIVLCTAPYSNESKGVRRYFFDAARRIMDDNYHFINVGYDGTLSNSDIPNNMTLIPYVKDQEELVKIYSIADLYVLPSTSDTMPLSCLIAIACGVPVCCFYTSGLKYMADLDSNVFRYAASIDTESLMEIILQTKKKDFEIMDECRGYAESKYSSVVFNQKIYEYLESI